MSQELKAFLAALPMITLFLSILIGAVWWILKSVNEQKCLIDKIDKEITEQEVSNVRQEIQNNGIIAFISKNE